MLKRSSFSIASISRSKVMPMFRVLLLLVIFSLSRSGIATAQFQRCIEPLLVTIQATAAAQAPEICRAADAALEFLARYGLKPQRPIQISLTEQAITGHGYSNAYGSYDSRSDRIELMTFAAIQQGAETPQMYGELFDEVHYAGAIAHEIAHAVVQHNLKTKLLSTGPQEYLAHSTQLGVMPEARRLAIIRAMDVAPWASGDAISDIYMALEPGKFAVKSYLHLTTSLEPRAFVDILLNSKWFYVYVP
jgi:hypothetical protein